MKVTETWTCS